MDEIRFVDTTLRDGQQSLWAEGMRTGMMLAVARQMDEAGFDAIELISGSHLKKCVRELRENPWERVRLMNQKIMRTPLRVIGAKGGSFEHNPLSISRLFLERMAANGIKQSRISDEWNDFSGWQRKVKLADEVGVQAIINLIYSVSPKHTDGYYGQKTREAASLRPFRLCLKDPGGLLTPERTRSLVPVVLEHSNKIPVEFHTHCTTGLGPLCCLEAIKLGIKTINTAVPPLANGSSNPSLYNVARNARALGYTPLVNETALQPVTDYLTSIARREGLPTGTPLEYDCAQYLHQVPGGMISNLRHQLARVGMEGKLAATLDEAVRVRADFGYPIMVTPLSQYVGTQAAMNIIGGERYKDVTDQTIRYALGQCGEEGSKSMDAAVKEKILNRMRAKELARWEAPEPSLAEVRCKLGGPGVSDEELLLRWLMGTKEVEALYRAGPAREYGDRGHCLVTLIQELTRRTDSSYIYIQKSGLSLKLERRLS